MMPSIEKDISIGHGEAGSLFLALFIGYVISLLGSGFIASKITHRKSIIVSAFLLGMVLIAISFSVNFWQLAGLLFLMGITGGLYLPSGIATITSIVSPSNFGKALAIHELAPNISFVVAPIVTELLLGIFTWRTIPMIFGIIGIVLCISFSFFGKGGEFPGEAPTFSALKILVRLPAFWIMILLFTLGITATMGIFSMLTLYLVSERGMESQWANNLIGFSRISCIFIAFIAGWVTDRLGAKRTLGGVMLITGITTILLGIAPDSWIVPLLFLQPIIAVCFFPAAFVAVSFIGPPSYRNVTISFITPIGALLGGGAIPMLLGVLGETASFAFGITCVGSLMILGFTASFFLKIREG